MRRIKITWRAKTWSEKKLNSAGLKTLNKIILQKSPDTIVVYAGPYMGDALFSMAFVKELKAQKPNNKIVILTPRTLWLVRTMNGYDEVKQINRSWDKKIVWIWIGGHSQQATENLVLNNAAFAGMEGYEQDDMYRLRHYIFQVGESAKIQYHNVVPKKVLKIPDFYQIYKRIVILNPYSNSCHFNKKDFAQFERLSEFLSAKGYIVYTNTIKDQLPICGTRELRCGLEEFLEICCKIHLIVSVRSGILDFVVKTNVNMIVLFSERKVIKKSTYSMKQWECNGKLLELSFDDFLQDKQFNAINEFLIELE